jgi:hypothetical protein
MVRHALSRATLGIPGLVGALLLAVWLVGWTMLGVHRGAFHALVPAGSS